MTDIDAVQEEVENLAKIARGERLMRLRGMANLSRADVAQQYGISAETLKNWELGRHTGLTEQGAKRVLAAFEKAGIHCSLGWLLNGTGAAPVILNTMSIAESQQPLLRSENQQIYTTLLPPNEISVFCDEHPNALYMQVVDEGMEPFYAKEDYVAGERHYQDDIQKTIEKDCIIETQMGQILLRRVKEGSKKGCYSLQCTNTLITHPAPFLYDVELASAAPVILHRRMKY